jgi:hypothetical protein
MTYIDNIARGGNPLKILAQLIRPSKIIAADNTIALANGSDCRTFAVREGPRLCTTCPSFGDWVRDTELASAAF